MSSIWITSASERTKQEGIHEPVEEHGFDTKTQKYPWSKGRELEHLDTEVTKVIEGTMIPETREKALELVNIRFGVVYNCLPERFQRDGKIRQTAVEKSSGYVLRRKDRKAVHVDA